MTGADLIRLAEDLAQCGGIHRLTNCLAAACHVFAEHERRAARTVEAWEDGPECGAGMSDKTVPPATVGELAMSIADAKLTALREAAIRPPSSEEPSGRAAEAQDGRGASETVVWAVPAKFIRCACGALYEPPHSHECDAGRFRRATNPAPVMSERGERQPVPMRTGNALADEHPRGITHGPGSPIVAEHSGPSDRRVPRFDGKRINPELTDGDGA